MQSIFFERTPYEEKMDPGSSPGVTAVFVGTA
jgi:hypothetical protein